MDIQHYINDYLSWLKSEITFSQVGDYYEITTPFLDAANDYLQFYIKQDGDKIFFTDDGFTINNLEMTGFTMTGNRKKQSELILNQFDVQLKDKELTLSANSGEFAQKKHAFLQCMMHVSDMYMTSRAKVLS